MPPFRARVFFDAGSGICLWAADNATRDAFNYPIGVRDLPPPGTTKALAEQVVRWYDASLNWWYLPDPLPEPWTEEEKRHVDRTASRLLAELRAGLGEGLGDRGRDEAARRPRVTRNRLTAGLERPVLRCRLRLHERGPRTVARQAALDGTTAPQLR